MKSIQGKPRVIRHGRFVARCCGPFSFEPRCYFPVPAERVTVITTQTTGENRRRVLNASGEIGPVGNMASTSTQRGFDRSMARQPVITPYPPSVARWKLFQENLVMKILLTLAGLVGVLMLSGCVVEPAYPAGGAVEVYGEYPYAYYGHGGYYPYHRWHHWHHPYDRDHYWHRPYWE
jgi:hypothetical protein